MLQIGHLDNENINFLPSVYVRWTIFILMCRQLTYVCDIVMAIRGSCSACIHISKILEIFASQSSFILEIDGL